MTEKTILMKSFILSNFHCCPLVWHFCSKRNTDKMEKIQKRALRMVLDDYEPDYETLLQKAKMQTLHVGRIKTLATEIYTTLHSLNPGYIRKIFKENSTGRRQLRSKHNLTIQRYNTVTFGRNSLRILGPKIWNHLSREFTMVEDLKTLKILLKQWNPTVTFVNTLTRCTANALFCTILYTIYVNIQTKCTAYILFCTIFYTILIS